MAGFVYLKIGTKFVHVERTYSGVYNIRAHCYALANLFDVFYALIWSGVVLHASIIFCYNHLFIPSYEMNFSVEWYCCPIFISPPNSTSYKMLPVLHSLHPSLLFPFLLLRSPVLSTELFFFIFSKFLAVCIMLSDNNSPLSLYIYNIIYIYI